MITVTLTLSTDAQGDGVATDTTVRSGYVTSVHFNFAAGTDAGADTTLSCVSENGPDVIIETISNSKTDAWKYPRALTNEPGAAAALNDTPIAFRGKLRVTMAQGGAEVADAVTVTVVIDKMVGYTTSSIPTSTVLAIQEALYGTGGITTFPAAAAAGNGVSMAEVMRYIQATQLGTIANTGGTATVGGILGDVANSSIAVRLTNMASQVARCTTGKAIASITSANLFTVALGPVRVLSAIGHITTGIEAAANAIKLTHTPTGGSAVDLCATLDVTGAAIRKVLVLNGVKATPLTLSTDEGVVTLANQSGMPIVLTPGTIALNCAGATSGAVTWYIEYEPLYIGATVAAA